MNIAGLLVLCALAGLGGHQTRPMLKRDFCGGWFPVSCYVIGAVILSPLVIALYLALGGKGSEAGRWVAAYYLGCLGVGAGVVAGHYLQPDA